MISPHLLDLLACPSCREKLRYEEQDDLLACAGCRRMYRVEDGLPIMLVDEVPVSHSSDRGTSERE